MYVLSLGHLCLSWVLHYASRSQRCMSSHVHSHSLILLSRLVWRLSLVGLKAGSIILNEKEISSLPSGLEMYQACRQTG
jgi:hypothetical protein